MKRARSSQSNTIGAFYSASVNSRKSFSNAQVQSSIEVIDKIPKESSLVQINYQDELVLLLYNALLENIVGEWIAVPIPEEQQLKNQEDEVAVTKSFKDITEEDIVGSQVVSVEGSKVSLTRTSKRSSKFQKQSVQPTKNSSTPSNTKWEQKSKHKENRRRSSVQKSEGSLRKKSRSRTSQTRQSEVLSVDTNTASIASHSEFQYSVSLDSVPPSHPSMDWILKTENEYVRIVFKNGNIYEGHVSRKLMHGKGTFWWADGSIYEGEFCNGYPTGRGQMILPNLSCYQGSFQKGLFHGEGVFYISGTEMLYSGNWKYGKKYGKGWLVYEPGNWYDGEWLDDLRHGNGLRKYKTGTMYKGAWENGLQEGQGTIAWCNHDFYRGGWHKGLLDGYGEYTWDGFYNDTFTFPLENQYLGSWVSGVRDGVGIIYFGIDGGSKLAGTWENNLKHGPGVLVCGNGFVIARDPLFIDDKPVHLTIASSSFTHQTVSKDGIAARPNTPLKVISKEMRRKKPKKRMPKAAVNAIHESRDDIAKFMALCNPVEIPLRSPPDFIEFGFYMTLLKTKIKERADCCCSCSCNFGDARLSKEVFVCGAIHETDTECLHAVQYDLEEKYLRKTITVNLAKLKAVYNRYATITSSYTIDFKPILIRLFLHQLWRDIGVLEYGFSLIDVDFIIDQNPVSGYENVHYPFEKIYFWQFLQALLSVSWILHLKTEKLMFEKNKGILASIFERFLKERAFQPILYSRASSLFDYKDLLPLQSVYLLYRSLGEPHTAREFLCNTCIKKKFKEPCYLSADDDITNKNRPGYNAVPVGSSMIYIPKSPPDIGEKPEEFFTMPTNDPFFKEMLAFRSLGPKRITHCLIDICPGIAKDGYITNMEYPLSFLEFYEVFLLCGFTLIDRKLKKEDRKKAREAAELEQKVEDVKKSDKKKGKQSQSKLTKLSGQKIKKIE